MRHAVHLPKPSLTPAQGRAAPYRFCFTISETGTPILLAVPPAAPIKTQPLSVSHVLLGCDVFEIRQGIVRLVTIPVIDLHSLRPLPNKRPENQGSYPAAVNSPPISQDHREIALALAVRFEKATSCSLPTVIAPHIPTIGHAVNTYEADDGFPAHYQQLHCSAGFVIALHRATFAPC